MDDATLRTVWQNRQTDRNARFLSEQLGRFMKNTLAKRVRQLSGLAEAWDELVPEEIRDHTALESYHRGTLTVLVDSSPHRYQLMLLLRGDLEAELRQRFSGALNRIKPVPGQFYSIDVETGQRRYQF